MIEVVCGVVEDGEGKILACRRAAHRHHGGLWEFPGGKIGKGEDSVSALKRELREELGITVEVGARFNAVVGWSDGEIAIRLCAYRCKVTSGEPQALEHSEIRWLRPDELVALEWSEADLPILAELLASA